MIANFSSETMVARNKEHPSFQMLKKNSQLWTQYPVKKSYKNKGEIYTFSDEGKLKEYVTSIHNLK